MEVESFEDEAVAKLLNDWFVSIKVSLCHVYYRSCSNYHIKFGVGEFFV